MATKDSLRSRKFFGGKKDKSPPVSERKEARPVKRRAASLKMRYACENIDQSRKLNEKVCKWVWSAIYLVMAVRVLKYVICMGSTEIIQPVAKTAESVVLKAAQRPK